MGSPQGSGSPSLALPRPKSPPELYAKRRDLAKLVKLEREIGFLQEELKSIEKLQPASFCIKEVADYVVTNPEPLITICRKNHKSCGFWKWLCGNPCFRMSSICCCCGCCLETPSCCCCGSCSLPKCTCSFKPRCPSTCFCCPNCSDNCCPKCPDYSCRCKCSCLCWPPKCSCPKLPKCSSCGCCSLNCCYSCCRCC
ncbi:uncharacterized protein [Rutidosis leptorrhynchoides]|uniref:uncharacterized protein n=1 Tax=Rutidosis leptorrhynchoides TaxID=125765 RepID=UPI003A991597